MEYLSIGQIVRTVGLKGEVKVYPSTHFRDSRFKKGNHVFILDENNNIVRDLTIKSHRVNGDCDNLIFDEISTIEDTEQIIHKYLCVEKDNNFLKKDSYFYSDLIGCNVYFDNGEFIGQVYKVEEYSSYSTLRVKTNKKDVLIPFVKAYLKDVLIDERKIIINYIKGLLWK